VTGKAERARERRRLIDLAAQSYLRHRDNWEPTADVARDLGVDLRRARYLVGVARSEGLLAQSAGLPDEQDAQTDERP